jgi:glutamate racemase
MEPAVKPAAEATRSGVIGVLATGGTLESGKFAELVQRFGSQARVIVQPCPGLVERIEAGDFDGPLTRDLLSGFVAPLLAQGADTLVLGCTHYPVPGAAAARTGRRGR